MISSQVVGAKSLCLNHMLHLKIEVELESRNGKKRENIFLVVKSKNKQKGMLLPMEICF